jgi:hypothetical protein
MMKKTLIAAAALTVMVLGAASPASAHYNNGYRYNFSYSGYPWWANSYAYKAYNYQPSCHYGTRPVTLKIWDEYSYSYYFKTVYRNVKICD